MKVQNTNLSGQALALRFAGTVVQGDAAGVFEVPEKDGEFLLQLQGWKKVETKPKAKEAPPAPAEVEGKVSEEPPAASSEPPTSTDVAEAVSSIWGGKKSKKGSKP